MSRLRRPAGRAGVVVAAAGLAPWGPGPVGEPAPLALMGWPTAIGVGLWMRAADARRRADLDAVRRDERLALARELHDVVAHHVTGIVLQAQAARLVGRDDPAALDAPLAAIESAGGEALTAVRRVVGVLRDAGDGAGVAPGPERLTELVQRFTGHGPRVALRLPEGEGGADWPPEVTTTVYRVVQEALTNVVRHAPGARVVTVTVAQDGRTVSVEVRDDAPGGAGAAPPAARRVRPGRHARARRGAGRDAARRTLRRGRVVGAGDAADRRDGRP